jgi:urease accessory protein
LHLCDSLFPTGGFAYSDGLEAATIAGQVATPTEFGQWLDVCLDEIMCRTEGPAIVQVLSAVHDERWRAVAALDSELMAMRPSAAGRQASRALGTRLLRTWQGLHPHPRTDRALALVASGTLCPTLPVAFAIVCAGSDIAPRSAVEAFAYTRLVSATSAAMRLMPIGQTEAHTMLARTLERVPAAVDAIIMRQGAPEAFAPAVDIAQMRHQYATTRLFRS